MARFDYIPQCHETPGSDNQWEHMAQGILLSYLRKHRAELTIKMQIRPTWYIIIYIVVDHTPISYYCPPRLPCKKSLIR